MKKRIVSLLLTTAAVTAVTALSAFAAEPPVQYEVSAATPRSVVCTTEKIAAPEAGIQSVSFEPATEMNLIPMTDENGERCYITKDGIKITIHKAADMSGQVTITAHN